MNTFLQQTARSIIDTMDWKQLSRTTLVLPSHRAGLVLKSELLHLQQERHAQAVWAPHVCTLPQLQDALSPLYAEDELMTVVRLYKLYRRLAVSGERLADFSLDQFYGWGRQMIADFTNIDASMPAEQVANFFDNTIAAHELSVWSLDKDVEDRLRALVNPFVRVGEIDRESVRAQYEQVWRRLYELYSALHAEMESEQKGYPGMRQRSVIEHWDDEIIQQKIAGRTYIFVGFNYLLPVERELMERLRDAGQALFYWDFVENFQTNEKAFSFAQKNSGILGSALPPRTWEKTRQVTALTCTSRAAQAQYVHQWLLKNYTAKGQKVGIVICDETMLEPVIYALPAVTLPGETQPASINITKGFPLRNTQVYADVLKWLNDRKRGDAQQLISPDFIDKLLEDIFVRDIEMPESDEIEESAPESPLTWKELLVLESEYQVRKIANQMRQIIADGLEDIPFTLKLLRMVMRRMMESVTMPFHGEPITDIQVMGVLETRMLDFDNLLILNVEEGIIPQRQNDSSFIPFYLRKAYHMQTSDERATVYAYNFFRLISRAEHTTVLYSQPDSSDSGKGMSRFLMQMIYAPNAEFNVQKMILQEASNVSENACIPSEHVFPRFEARSLSPSALNTYLSCPRKFALRYILGIHEPEQEEVFFLPSTLGSFVHLMMEYIYKHCLRCTDPFKPTRIDPDEIERIRTNDGLMQEALREAYRVMEKYIPEHHTSENKAILNYVNNILMRDRDDARKGLQVWLLEEPCSMDWSIEGIGKVQIRGKVDRLDIVGEGQAQRIRVVDYKTGKYNPAKLTATWDEVGQSDEKDYVRQTLLYGAAVSESLTKTKWAALPIEPNLFFCQVPLNDEVQTNVSVEDRPVQNVSDVKNEIVGALQPKIEEIFTATLFPLCAENKCKKFCPYFSLCGRKPKEF